MHCNVCQAHLCKDCVGIHFSDKSQAHNVVPIEQFLSNLSYPNCSNHPTKQCELHCKQCDIPICASCVSSRKHFGHEIVDIFEGQKRNFEKRFARNRKLNFPQIWRGSIIHPDPESWSTQKLPETDCRNQKNMEKPCTKKLTLSSKPNKLILMSWTQNTRQP